MTRHLSVLLVEPEGHEGHWHYTVALAQSLKRRGIDVGLATLGPYEQLKELEQIPIWVIGWSGSNEGGTGRRQNWRIFGHVEKLVRLGRAVVAFRPRVLHLQGSLGRFDFAYFALIRFLGTRIIYTAHHLEQSTRWRQLDSLRYRAADRVVVLSLNAVADLEKYGVPRSRIVLTPHPALMQLVGNGTMSRAEAKAILGLPDGARTLLFFGHIEPRKGLDLLIDAYAFLSRSHSDIYLIVAGRPGQEAARHVDRISQAQLTDRVIFDFRYVPFDRMQVYFACADVVVLPYRQIYQSGILLWAYVFGRPVVVTNVGGIGEAVKADGTGVIADALEGEAIARAILELLTDRALARGMEARARLLARTKYSSEVVAEELEVLYRGLEVDVTPHKVGP